MNRLVLIGNGFDLAHGLKTSYKDFICWYWKERVLRLYDCRDKTSDDGLCKFSILTYETWNYFLFYNHIQLKFVEDTKFIDVTNDKETFGIEYYPLFERIHKSIETKGWVDIENDYYDLLKEYLNDNAPEEKIVALHSELQLLLEKLVEYLKSIKVSDELLNTGIRQKIYAPFKTTEISISGQQVLKEHIEAGLKLSDNDWDWKLRPYDSICYTKGYVEEYKKRLSNNDPYVGQEEPPHELMLPNKIMLLNFNYTPTAHLYLKESSLFSINQIHGNLNDPSSVIFGYGDELDENFRTLLNRNDNKYLCNIKSIKYLEADNYRKMLSFIESEPYQILIMGHSCGNSDRTLLNTLFEHKNCVSIKPYYYKYDKDKDNYIDLVQNISRNFTDMKLMRDRVVNKTYCEPLTNNNS
ncbi:bacteriophage abortive infection AbiH family protein [Prevotella communis]|uniref:AbiH family protein n=1 Tax=Prevotella communis TaxID=2913614 RepID=UPI001EDB6C1F|nr:AbiH family protein [Prevotella communis]UKK60600.1 bacteriophage abortive infection AbiH family protein [Prevotella communis]